MNRLLAVVSVSIAILATGTASAKPKRAVVLLDFTRVPPSATDAPALSPLDVDSVSLAMTRQFTGAAVDIASPGLPAWAQSQFPPPPASPASLGNPFVTYALSRQPYAAALATLPMNALGCTGPGYRPSLGFGRSTEERRRIIYPLVQQAACEHGLPVGLLDALVMQESRYQATARSPKGAFGLSQLMPGTARNLGVDAYSLADNLRGGARYLKQQVVKFGRYDLALAAYNAGPSRVQRNWAIPGIAETQGYVQAIMANWTGAPPTAIVAPRSMPYRKAQLIFMPARSQQFAQATSLNAMRR